jgi:DNA topoisomerase-2
MKELDSDIVSLMKKRVYDLAGCTPKSVNIYLNGKKIEKVRDFESYVNMYLQSFKGEGEEQKPIYFKSGRWEVCFMPSSENF